MGLTASPKIIKKLTDKHGVILSEVEEAFTNNNGSYVVDTRQKHQTIPPTLWFIAETDERRLLKVVFIESGDDIYLKTAYEPSELERRIYFEKQR